MVCIGRDVVLDGMWCWMECGAGWNVVLDGMWCWMECGAGWNVVLDGMWCWMGYSSRIMDVLPEVGSWW